jgi:hypothetical protein
MPFSERDRWPLVCDTNGIVWIPGFRLREGVFPKNIQKKYLEMTIQK